MTGNENDPFDDRSEHVPMSAEEATRIATVLRERAALGPCPRCGKADWGGPVYGSSPMENVVNRRAFMGPFLATVKIICQNCGFLSEHGLIVLGLVPEAEQG
jgi:hypothetical protein